MNETTKQNCYVFFCAVFCLGRAARLFARAETHVASNEHEISRRNERRGKQHTLCRTCVVKLFLCWNNLRVGKENASTGQRQTGRGTETANAQKSCSVFSLMQLMQCMGENEKKGERNKIKNEERKYVCVYTRKSGTTKNRKLTKSIDPSRRIGDRSAKPRITRDQIQKMATERSASASSRRSRKTKMLFAISLFAI